jgi:hypothetical protein
LQLQKRIDSSVRASILKHIPRAVESSVGRSLEPIKKQLDQQEATIAKLGLLANELHQGQEDTQKAIVELSSKLSNLHTSVAAQHTSAAAQSSGNITSALGGSVQQWTPRAGVAYIGGFPRDSSRAYIVECIRSLLSGFEHRHEVISVWAPDKRWSNGRCQFPSDLLVFKFVEYVQQNPGIRTFGQAPHQHELWVAKEKSLGRKNQDRVTTEVAKIIGSFLERKFVFDPQKYEVMYLGLQIWFNKKRVAHFDRQAKRWLIADLIQDGVSESERASLQSLVDGIKF